MRRIVVSALVALLLAVFAGTAAAAPNRTPTGWVGACNMNSSWPTLSPGEAVGIQGTIEFDGDGGGMENAMTVNQSQNTNGTTACSSPRPSRVAKPADVARPQVAGRSDVTDGAVADVTVRGVGR
jgi:hypothetical protein